MPGHEAYHEANLFKVHPQSPKFGLDFHQVVQTRFHQSRNPFKMRHYMQKQRVLGLFIRSNGWKTLKKMHFKVFLLSHVINFCQ